MSDYRDQLAAMPSLALLALNDELNPSLCWNCNTQQGFYSSPCEKCGAINPNFDLDGALAQQGASVRETVTPCK